MKDREKYKDLFYSLISQKIIDFRKKKGIKQDVLARNLNIARTSLINIEKSRQQISLFMLFEIAQHLELELSDLIPSMEEFKKMVNADQTARGIDVDVSQVFGVVADKDINTLEKFIKVLNKHNNEHNES